MRAITRFEARDGSVHDVEQDCRKHEAALDGRHHRCPKCSGSGRDPGAPIYNMIVHRGPEPNSVDGFGAHQCVVTEKRFTGHAPCDVCSGFGYTKEPKRPITRTQVVGYE